MSNEMKSGIYCIENKINNKKYIGQAFDIKQRWTHHKGLLRHNSHNNEHLQSSWNKYGEENFDFYILELCSLDNLDAREIYYIEYYNSMNNDFGYNLRSGGQNGGAKYSAESRKKMSDAQKKLCKNPEHVKMLKEISLKNWENDEFRASRSGENHPMFGKHHSEETKRILSEKNRKPKPKRTQEHCDNLSRALTGRISSNRNLTPVMCIELNKIFQDAITAGKELGIKSPNHVIDVCMGRRNMCSGYHFRFVNNMENNI